MVQSTSCPMPVTMGMSEAAIARATTSSLNDQRVLQGTAAARQHDHVDAADVRRVPIQVGNGLGDLRALPSPWTGTW